MFNNIPKNRLFLYLMLVGLVPIFLAIAAFYSQISSTSELISSVQAMQQIASLREKKQAANVCVRNYYHDSDHFYIDKHLETLTFLEPEVEGLQKLLTNKNLADDEAIKKRLDFLTGPTNSMSFSEGIVQSTPTFQETTETLVHSVEINNSDLQKILSRIDGIEIGPFTPIPNRPQLIVLEFKLDRKNLTEKNEVFILNLKLLKREFI
jgi:hypothetical protein